MLSWLYGQSPSFITSVVMIQLDWPCECGKVHRSSNVAFPPSPSTHADCGEEMMLIVGRGIANEDNHRLWFRVWELPWKHICLERMNVLRICPKVMFNILNCRQNLQRMSNWKLLKCSEQGKLWNQESAEVVGFGLPLIYTRQRLPQTPHYTRPADWIRAVFPSMSSQFHQKYKKR